MNHDSASLIAVVENIMENLCPLQEVLEEHQQSLGSLSFPMHLITAEVSSPLHFAFPWEVEMSQIRQIWWTTGFKSAWNYRSK